MKKIKVFLVLFFMPYLTRWLVKNELPCSFYLHHVPKEYLPKSYYLDETDSADRKTRHKTSESKDVTVWVE